MCTSIRPTTIKSGQQVDLEELLEAYLLENSYVAKDDVITLRSSDFKQALIFPFNKGLFWPLNLNSWVGKRHELSSD